MSPTSYNIGTTMQDYQSCMAHATLDDDTIFQEDEVPSIKHQTSIVQTNTGTYLIGPPTNPRDWCTVTRMKEHVVDTNTGRFLIAPPIRPGHWCSLVRVGKNYGRDRTERIEQLDGTNDTITSVDWSSTASVASTAIDVLPVSNRKHVASLDWSEPVLDEWSNPTTVEHILKDTVTNEVNAEEERAASKDVTSRPTDPTKSRRDSAIGWDTKLDEIVTSTLPLCRIGNSYRERPSDIPTALSCAPEKIKTTEDIVPSALHRPAAATQHWKRLSDASTTTSSPSDKSKTTISQATINRLSTPKHMSLRVEQSRPCSPTKSLPSTPNGAHDLAEPASQGTLRGNAPAYNPTTSTVRRAKHEPTNSDEKTLPHDPPPTSVQSSPATSLYAAYRTVSCAPKDKIESSSASTDFESHALFSQSVAPESQPTSTFAPLFPYVETEAEEKDPNIELAARISTLTRTFVKEYVSIVKGVAGVTYPELHAHMFQALERADGTEGGKTILVDEERLEELRREWYGCGEDGVEGI